MQKRVLLSLIEPMYLVDEHDGAFTKPAAILVGFRHHRAHLAYSSRHRAEGHESRRGLIGDDAGKRCLPGPRRPPEDERLQSVVFDHLAKRGPVPRSFAGRRTRLGSRAASGPRAVDHLFGFRRNRSPDFRSLQTNWLAFPSLMKAFLDFGICCSWLRILRVAHRVCNERIHQCIGAAPKAFPTTLVNRVK